ncbi:Multidrug resistance-associated protein 7, partial [Operophtera brumata]
MALDGVTFSSYPGEKLAVVGRTGAGKSSLVQAILRLSPLASGAVRIDGVDVTTLHLHSLSVRDNVDPLRQYSAEEVTAALEACGAGAVVSALGAPASELSRGNAQILLVDEATANMDHETERQILDTIRWSFGGSTVLFIAHRPAGVLDCTRVMVLSGGRVVELRAPDDALADYDSHFYKLVCGE